MVKKYQLSTVNCQLFMLVGERRIGGEVAAEAAVDCIRVRMPE